MWKAITHSNVQADETGSHLFSNVLHPSLRHSHLHIYCQLLAFTAVRAGCSCLQQTIATHASLHTQYLFSRLDPIRFIWTSLIEMIDSRVGEVVLLVQERMMGETCPLGWWRRRLVCDRIVVIVILNPRHDHYIGADNHSSWLLLDHRLVVIYSSSNDWVPWRPWREVFLDRMNIKDFLRCMVVGLLGYDSQSVTSSL